MTDVSPVFNKDFTLTESPVWSPEEQALYFIDIYAGNVWRFDPASGHSTSWPMSEPVGSIALRKQGGIIAATASGFCFLDTGTGNVEKLYDPEPDKRNNRFNDGRCDRAGRFWAGTMIEKGNDPDAALYRFDPDRSCRRMVDRLCISNGLAWSPDSRTMYHSDSRQSTVWAYDYDVETGSIDDRRVFATMMSGEGRPDGAAVDEEGCYWSARYDGWRIVRHNHAGHEIQVIKTPIANPTMIAFGGRNLDVMYVTSASRGLPPEKLAQQPNAGGVFAVEPGVRGLAEPRFAG
jgi:sugar lactone lactonase YvrE